MAVVLFGRKKKTRKTTKKRDLESLICDFQCGIQQQNMPCHATTDTLAMRTRERTLQFGGKLGILVKYSAIF